MDLYKWQQLREVAWSSLIAPHLDPKKMPKRKEQFLPLEGEKQIRSGVSEQAKQLFIQEMKKFQDKIKQA